jgi:CBS-domain-containing membrane protein
MTQRLIMDALREKRLTTTVADVMKRDFETVQANDSLAKVFATIHLQPHGSYPVLENNRLQGVVDLNNLNELVAIQNALSHQG